MSKKVYDKKTEHYHIRDYKTDIENPEGVPGEQENRRYQGIIKGKNEQEGERTYTTNIGGSIDDVSNMASFLMELYGDDDFDDEIIIRVYDVLEEE